MWSTLACDFFELVNSVFPGMMASSINDPHISPIGV